MADHVQLQQVLLNLIVNACDAMQAKAPRERQLTLTTAIVNQDGDRTEYTYDERGNLLTTASPDGSAVELKYNKANKPEQIRDGAGAVARDQGPPQRI